MSEALSKQLREAISMAPMNHIPSVDMFYTLPEKLLEQVCEALEEYEANKLDESMVVAWCNPYAIKRVAANDGILRTMGFKENLANSKSELYSVGLIPYKGNE